MISARRVIAFAALLHFSAALVEFSKSKLYDETDFKQNFPIEPAYCDTLGCRIYVSVPAASVDIAKKIMMKDNIHNEPEGTSLYDISQLPGNDGEKGYFRIADGTQQINFINNNPASATAPIVVWVVKGDADNTGDGKVYEAADLVLLPAALYRVTVMSAEPFTLRTTTEGPLMSIATLSGYDAVDDGSPEECTNVFRQLDDPTYADVQVLVQSPLISFFFDTTEYLDTSISLTATVGQVNTLDFSGLSFVASPGFMCKGDKNYYSSLYGAKTSCTYAKCGWQYDIDVSTVINLNDQHPVTLKDNTNNIEYKWPGANPELALQQTSNIDITWTSNPDLSFLIRLTPSNEQQLGPEVICETTTTQEPERTTTQSPHDIPDDTTTVAHDQPDHTNPPEPVKTTTAKPTTTASTPLKTVHPKDISSTAATKPTTTTITPTTSETAGYDSATFLLILATAILL